MAYCDLLRMTTLLSAGVATALAAIAVVLANRSDDTTTLLVAGGWWTVAIAAGLVIGRPARAERAMRSVLAGARTTPTLPTDNPGRVALERLWPFGAFAVVAGGVGLFLPGVAAIGAGYGLVGALAWRSRERAVYAIEERDGTRFYVEPGSALGPVKLIRTPGLRRGRDPAGDPPLPPRGVT